MVWEYARIYESNIYKEMEMIDKNYLVNRIIERDYPNNFSDIWIKGTPANKMANRLRRKTFTELFEIADIESYSKKLANKIKK
jgi:hypothetical protein